MAFDRSNYYLYLSGDQLKKLISHVLGVSERSVKGLPVRGDLCKRFDSSRLREGRRRNVFIRFEAGFVPYVLNLFPAPEIRCMYGVYIGIYQPSREMAFYSDRLGYVNSDTYIFYPEEGPVDDAFHL